MRGRHLAVGLAALVAAYVGLRTGLTFSEADRCLDRGGAWYGHLGCETTRSSVDRIVIEKAKHTLTAYSGGHPIRRFAVALGRVPTGSKQVAGDHRTPEGTYPVSAHKPDSSFSRALRLGYPTPVQQSAARARGFDPGGDIMIHGIRNGLGWIGSGHRLFDWTDGCIALDDDEIRWLYDHTPDLTPVDIQT